VIAKKGKLAYAEEVGDVIVHFDENGKTVSFSLRTCCSMMSAIAHVASSLNSVCFPYASSHNSNVQISM